MNRALLLAALSSALVLGGCHMGESTAPKPDPAKFLPQGAADKPITSNSPNNPPSTP